MMQESKIVFNDGDRIRCIRGIIIKEDEHFIYIRRRNGNLALNKSTITKIEQWKEKGGGVNET